MVSIAIRNLLKNNPFGNATIDNKWENLSEQSDPVLWGLLTNKDARDFNNSDQTDSDDDIEDNDKFKERIEGVFFATVMYNVGGQNIPPSEFVNVAPVKGQLN